MARPGAFRVTGGGLVLVARVPLRTCEGEATKSVVPAGRAEELTWAEGRMHAHLDVGAELSPEVYLGRLSGSAPVAEHVHAEQWEILAAVEAAGTFTLNGVPRRLGAGVVVAVPPGTRHSWQPDPGSTLVAVQLYDPPGPEQRFVGLAKAAAQARGTSP
jgi:mannose-6-phosphate isomerase-like protein (cupin superfamily)